MAAAANLILAHVRPLRGQLDRMAHGLDVHSPHRKAARATLSKAKKFSFIHS